MKVGDLQFARYFVLGEIDLQPDLDQKVLSCPIEMADGEADSVSFQEDKIVYSNPSSVTRFLFHTIYTALAQSIDLPIQRDKFALGLLHMCKSYVYAADPEKRKGPPIVLDFDKMSVPSFIIRELAEPLVGNIKKPLVFFTPCRFTDSCRPIDSLRNLEKQYNCPRQRLRQQDFPLLISNCSIHNPPAVLADLTVRCLELNLGEESANRLLRKILLGDRSMLENLILITKTIRNEPIFTVDFLQFMQSHVKMSNDERTELSEKHYNEIAADQYLSTMLKVAGPPDTQVARQWSQWSMLMGLIEKQLTPMRGSMWPATENVKPHEDRLRAMMAERAAEKKKNQLNFEEMLEVYRDLYDHNVVEPGKLVEVIMKDERAWKT